MDFDEWLNTNEYLMDLQVHKGMINAHVAAFRKFLNSKKVRITKQPMDFERWLYKYLFRMHRVTKSIRVADIRASARRQLLDGSVKEKDERIKWILDDLVDQGILARFYLVPRAYINPCYTFTDLTPMLEIM